jgi:hypothetical protein
VAHLRLKPLESKGAFRNSLTRPKLARFPSDSKALLHDALKPLVEHEEYNKTVTIGEIYQLHRYNYLDSLSSTVLSITTA